MQITQSPLIAQLLAQQAIQNQQSSNNGTALGAIASGLSGALGGVALNDMQAAKTAQKNSLAEALARRSSDTPVGPLTSGQQGDVDLMKALPQDTLSQIAAGRFSGGERVLSSDAYGNPLLVDKKTGMGSAVQGVDRFEGFNQPAPAQDMAPQTPIPEGGQPSLEQTATPVQQKQTKLDGLLKQRDDINAKLRMAPPKMAPQLSAQLRSVEGEIDYLREPTAGQKAIDTEAGKELAGFLTGGFADAQKNLNQVKGVLDTLKNRGDRSFTGTEFAFVPGFADAVVAPDATALRERVEEVIQRNLREVLGAQFTEKEGERLIARAYNQNLSEEENISRLEALVKQMETAMNQKMQAAEYFNSNGTLQGFSGALPSIADFDTALDAIAPSAPKLNYQSPEEVQAAFANSQISQAEAMEILRGQFGFE